MPPIYLFSHPENPEQIIEVFQGMNDIHEYIDENGLKWNREFTKPTASIDTKWDANSQTDFVNKVGSKKGTMGDIYDKSAELSAERAKRYGKDPIKEKHFADYRKKTGKQSHQEIQESIPKEIKI